MVGFLAPKEDQFAKATPENPVTRILCLWQPAQGQGLDNLPTRGFVGQIAFFAGQSATPVEVEGNVEILLFDDQGTPDQQSKPIHTFRFVDGSWEAHRNETAWGPTYQVFIPYIRKGDHRAACALCVRFDPQQGPRAISDMANIVLLGTTEDRNLVNSSSDLAVSSAVAAQLVNDAVGDRQNQWVGPGAASGSVRPPDPAHRPTGGSSGFQSFSIPFVIDRVGGN